MLLFGAAFIRGRRLINKKDFVNYSSSAAIDKQIPLSGGTLLLLVVLLAAKQRKSQDWTILILCGIHGHI